MTMVMSLTRNGTPVRWVVKILSTIVPSRECLRHAANYVDTVLESMQSVCLRGKHCERIKDQSVGLCKG